MKTIKQVTVLLLAITLFSCSGEYKMKKSLKETYAPTLKKYLP